MIFFEEIKEIKEYRKNGTLKYECTMAYIRKGSEYLFDRRIQQFSDGRCFIYINTTKKYKENGKLEWALTYNAQGELIECIREKQQKNIQLKLF